MELSLNVVTLLYLVASVCFIQALKGLSHPTTSVRGNVFGMVGMGIAVFTTAALIVYRPGWKKAWLIMAATMVVDVDNNGLSDLLIADFTTYHLWLQREDGSFSHFPLTVDVVAETYEEVPRYTPRKPYLIDTNLDESLERSAKALEVAQADLRRKAESLRESRKKAFDPLRRQIVKLLHELGIPNASLSIVLSCASITAPPADSSQPTRLKPR